MTYNISKLTLIENIQRELSNTINTIHNHPYIDALEKKQNIQMQIRNICL